MCDTECCHDGGWNRLPISQVIFYAHLFLNTLISPYNIQSSPYCSWVQTQLSQFHQGQKTQMSSPWCWILIDALFSHEENWMISIENSEPWSQDHNHRPKFHLLWWHFLKSWNLKWHDCATPMKLTNAIAFVRPSKHVEQISHSLASCSNLLLKCFEWNHKRCSEPQKFP